MGSGVGIRRMGSLELHAMVGSSLGAASRGCKGPDNLDTTDCSRQGWSGQLVPGGLAWKCAGLKEAIKFELATTSSKDKTVAEIVFSVLVKMMGIALEYYSALIVFMVAVMLVWLVSKIASMSASMMLVTVASVAV